MRTFGRIPNRCSQQIASREMSDARMYRFREEEKELNNVEDDCGIRDNRSSLAPCGRAFVRSRRGSRQSRSLQVGCRSTTKVNVAFPCQGNINIGRAADKMEGSRMATRERGECRD